MKAQLPFLEDDVIAEICKPLINPAAQFRFITEQLGLHAARKRDGRPLVARSEFERVLGAARLEASKLEADDVAGDIAAIRNRWRKKNGPKA